MYSLQKLGQAPKKQNKNNVLRRKKRNGIIQNAQLKPQKEEKEWKTEIKTKKRATNRK